MKRALIILACALSVAVHAAPAPPVTSGTLLWLNGDAMTGSLVAATGTTASWQSPLFADPVVVTWDALHRADWPVTAASGTDPFFCTMRDGSTILGDLVAVSGSSVTIHGSRYGSVQIDRGQLLSARRREGDDLVFSGPAGEAGWQPRAPDNNDDNGDRKDSASRVITAMAGGGLCLPYWNRGAILNVALPDAMDIEFHVQSSEQPNFRLTLGDTPGANMAIQTWGDEIVVTSGADFKLVRKMAPSDREVALRLCWDRTARRCQVYTPGGQLLADWTVTGVDTTGNGGLLLQNKGSDLELSFLRVRKWNGAAPPVIDASQPRVELADGRIMQGAPSATGTDGALVLSGSAIAPLVTGTAPRVTGTSGGLGLKDVDAIVFSADTSGTGSSSETLTYADGTYLKGRILSVAQGVATVETAFSANPLPVSMDGLRQLTIQPPGAAPADGSHQAEDILRLGKVTLHGTLTGGDDANPRWLPAGGVVAVTPSPAAPFEIQRYVPPDRPIASSPALFYTHGGDVLPGNLHSLDRTGVEFDSGITQATRLPAASLEAIQFGSGGIASLHGFSTPGWTVIKGNEKSVRRTGDSVEMDPGSALGNAGAMQSSDIRFRIKTGAGLSAIRVRLFCEGTEPAKSHNLLFASNGMMLMCGSEANEGQFDEPRVDAQAPDGDIEVRLEILDDDVNVYLNGVSALKVPVSAASRAGSGLVIEPAGVWGNTGQSVTITDFSMSAKPGATWLPEVAPDVKGQALSIPRFRRDDPPLHALIAANGDLLRGEIEAATTSSFGFRSGMEELTVPRDRVKAVIWLPKPIEVQPPAATAAPKPLDAILDQRMNMMITFGQATLSSMTNWLQASYPGLKFQLPPKKKKRKRGQPAEARAAMMSLGSGTVRETLDKVCAAFGMKYSVDDNGVIVIVPDNGAAHPADLVDKVYWLKPGSLPADAPAEKTLAAKGISFPAGTDVEWQPDEGQLTMRNTAASQERLAQLVNTDFGGSMGSPTHWLVLTSGARMALAVDKFGKDAITGWHPLYGRCTIRTQDVAMVRSYPLAPSAAMKSLQGWQPYYAPEPVLPTAGGDSDASIGKPAAEFKLGLLGGGQFDLAANKGKVVVLDFWATWCGPCVRSLPGLIDSMKGFPPDRVTFVGVNQDEPSATVQQFLETRGWKLAVALDDGGTVGHQYGADSIPHTVIVGADGKIAWVKTGYDPDGEGDAAKEVTQLLNPAPAVH
jgi:thiol-disulfide isomerase/thioredoxin